MRYFSTVVLWLGLALTACSSSDDGRAPGNADTRLGDGLPDGFSALFVLGDSLSDVGNAAGAADYVLDLEVDPPTVGLCNPADVLVVPRPCEDLLYRKSRVSDGPVAVEHLAAALEIGELVPSLHVVPNRPVSGTNYAIASATARGSTEKDLERQVDALLLDEGTLPSDALYVVMIGGNDAIDALQAESEDAENQAETSDEIVAAAVAAIGDSVERLLDFGARRLIVANVPDLSSLPAVRAEAAAAPDEQAVLDEARAISAAFDTQLGARLAEIESSGQWHSPGPIVVEFDLLAALEDAKQAAAAAGDNVTDACFDSETYRETSAEREFHPECAPAEGEPPRFDDFVFWDGIHPTGETHAAIGRALIASSARR